MGGWSDVNGFGNGKKGGKGTPEPSERLYLKGLPANATEDSVKAIFGQYGAVTDCKVLPIPAGMTNAVGFISMGSVQEATWLVENLSDNIPQGMTTPVNITYAADRGKGGANKGGKGMDQSMSGWGSSMSGWDTWSGSGGGKGDWNASWSSWGGTDKGKDGGKTGGKGFAAADPTEKLYLAGLPTDFTEDKLKAIFGQYGSVTDCKVLPVPPGLTNAAAFVTMGTLQEAKWLLDNLNGNIPQGMSTPVTISYRSASKGKGDGKGSMDWGKGFGKDRFTPYGSQGAGGFGSGGMGGYGAW